MPDKIDTSAKLGVQTVDDVLARLDEVRVDALAREIAGVVSRRYSTVEFVAAAASVLGAITSQSPSTTPFCAAMFARVAVASAIAIAEGNFDADADADADAVAAKRAAEVDQIFADQFGAASGERKGLLQ